MKLPLYELRINEGSQSIVDAIALVEEPAIESDFLAFSKDAHREMFASNDERMELLGAAMVPDMKIFRKDPDGTEYNVFFSKDTIREIAQVYFKKGFQSNLNLHHTATPAKSFIFQSYIVDSEKGMTAPKGLDLPDGTWVVGVKVTDPKVWGEIKAGKVKGFSVEGLFEFFEPAMNTTNPDEQELMNALKLLNHLLQNKAKSK
ncbi:XkdF-like putative serine protease domain-containing protein [Flaviaesturariibacter amylovorans]|uniref:Phage-like element PBSX protein XkdF domain-containing protein n=1 Tax=Flaviaesturariibacter amylovorans TaxID=1084520 RepID=A0ABP8GL04_9BACT